MKVLGLMSGTSLDGVDLVLTEFSVLDKKLVFTILGAQTIEYPEEFLEKLSNSFLLNGLEFSVLDIELGNFYAEIINGFLQRENLSCDYISSHGHTVFHQPGIGLTKQIGNGAVIYAKTGIPVVCDFRSEDVAFGGQGAPLVPVGDQLLFSEYSACLNLGGIANISFQNEEKRVAYDICPVNMGLNYFAQKLGCQYDAGGELAKSGKVDLSLLNKLNQLAFYKQPYPKSLGKEWFDKAFLPLCFSLTNSDEDSLATLNEHIAVKISESILAIGNSSNTVLCTGGGTYNSFLISKIEEYVGNKAKIIIPKQQIIDFKEGLVFALLGYLKVKGKNNILKSVTGCKKDHSAGCLYGVIS